MNIPTIPVMEGVTETTNYQLPTIPVMEGVTEMTNYQLVQEMT